MPISPKKQHCPFSHPPLPLPLISKPPLPLPLKQCFYHPGLSPLTNVILKIYITYRRLQPPSPASYHLRNTENKYHGIMKSNSNCSCYIHFRALGFWGSGVQISLSQKSGNISQYFHFAQKTAPDPCLRPSER